MKRYSFWWLLPFLLFLIGYALARLALYPDTVIAPQLIGLSLYQGIKTASGQQLNVRLLGEKQDPDVPEGTILDQSPIPGSSIRPHQSLFIVVAKAPPQTSAPNIIQQNTAHAEKLLSRYHLKMKPFRLPSVYPLNTCFAQHPKANSPSSDNKVMVYVSTGSDTIVLLPSFINRPYKEVKEFLDTHRLSYTCPPDLSTENGVITDQKPLPGTLIHRDKALTIQLIGRNC